MYFDRKEIYSEISFSFGRGGILILTGIVLYILSQIQGAALNRNDYASLTAFSAVVFLLGTFMLCYGTLTFRRALFPLLFLLFIIPIPSFLMERIIYYLQSGSTEFVELLLKLTGFPYFRDGFSFHLSKLSVEVAKECSGIRSGLALFITALLAGHFFLKTGRNMTILALCVFPVTMFKNGIRIVTLSLLGNYVNPRILESSLHREGGIPFFVLALLLLSPILYFLRKMEKKLNV